MKIAKLMGVLLFALLLVGCTPKGDPKEILESYYQNVKDGNLQAAYEKFAEGNKRNISKEDYILYQRLLNECYELKEFKILKSGELKNVEIEGNKYRNVLEFNVTQTVKDFYNNKETSETFKRKVVNDDGVWKLYSEAKIKEAIARCYHAIGWMYAEGKGKDKNLNEAAKAFNEAIKINPDLDNAYYGQAVAYLQLLRYDDSIEKINTYIQKIKDNDELSNAYNVLGLCYLGKNQKQKARESFDRAIKLNPNNEYAKTNLKTFL